MLFNVNKISIRYLKVINIFSIHSIKFIKFMTFTAIFLSEDRLPVNVNNQCCRVNIKI